MHLFCLILKNKFCSIISIIVACVGEINIYSHDFYTIQILISELKT